MDHKALRGRADLPDAGVPPSTYYARKTRPSSARTVRDEELLTHVRRVHEASHGTYGARRIWHQLRRNGVDVARCTVERLMRAHGIEGAPVDIAVGRCGQ